MNVEMGKTYWKIDNTTNSFDTLISTIEGFGIVAENKRPFGDEYGFKRVVDWKTPCGLAFSTIWHINLCTIRLGDWDSDFAEIHFDRICGSYGPYCNHDTIDFIHKGEPMFRLALKEG